MDQKFGKKPKNPVGCSQYEEQFIIIEALHWQLGHQQCSKVEATSVPSKPSQKPSQKDLELILQGYNKSTAVTESY